MYRREDVCPAFKIYPHRELTLLILDCWQREYDKRPYQNFSLDGKHFKARMHRRMSGLDVFKLVDFVCKRDLRRFELKNLDHRIGEAALKSLAVNLKDMLEISLIGIYIPADMISALANIAKYCNVKVLKLSANVFKAKHAEYLREFLLQSRSIEFLDCGYCDVDHIKFATIADGVINSKSLQSLDMSRIVNLHNFSIVDDDKIASIIAIVMGQCVKLREVKFKLCKLIGLDMIPISEYLARPTNGIQFVDFSSNRIGPDGAKLLLKAAIKCHNLIGIEIANNRLGELGGETVAHLLPFTQLKYFGIRNNGIPAKIMQMILFTIRKTHPIRVLHIFGNKFDYEVGEVLRRKIASGVLIQDYIDVTVSYDKDFDKYRVVPIACPQFDYNYHLKIGSKWTSNAKSLFVHETFDDEVVNYMDEMCGDSDLK